MAVSLGPTIPTESSQGVPAGGFSTWFKNIGDWLKSLSPAGSTQYDTDWVSITVSSPFVAQGGVAPQVRRIGKQVSMRGGISATGMTTSASHAVGVIPAGFRPPQGMYERLGTNAGFQLGQAVISPNGNVEIRTGTSLGGYYMFDGQNWLLD